VPPPSIEWLTSADDEVRGQVARVVQAVSGAGGAVGWVAPLDRAGSDAWLAGLLSRDVRLAAARVAGRIEGLGRWERYGSPVLAVNADVRQVMVHPDARGQGLARRLVLALVADARAAGIETLTLDVRGNNHAAQALYESVGFLPYGRLANFVAVGADRFDRVCYSLELGRPATARLRGSRVEGPGASRRREPPAEGG
jgi:ribosomal protein S18 acetylase RimI-like enzyme